MSKEKTFATVREPTRLRKGMRWLDRNSGMVYLVVMVNQCRALCEPETKTREVRIQKRFGEEGEEVVFHAKASSISISPNSEVQIL